MTRIAVLQMTSGIDPGANLATILTALSEARGGGAQMLFTPEMSLLLDRDRERARPNIHDEGSQLLQRLCQGTAEQGLWLALGSMAVRRSDGLLANRSYVISPAGSVVARYDKIHMFDVALSTGENWKESAAYAPGEETVSVAGTPVGKLGLAVCYDVRFPALFEALGRQACDVIAIPAAFTVPTGEAHWHLLQRARAVEASAYVVAAAQAGEHADGRRTYGHSLVVDPWGEVVLDMGGHEAGLGFADIDRARIAQVRAQLPSLANRRPVATSAP